MSAGLVTLCQLVAAFLFIGGIGSLRTPRLAWRAFFLSLGGMLLAVFTAFMAPGPWLHPAGLVALALGALGGVLLARRAPMTAAPQTIALLHAFVGLSAVMVGISRFHDPGGVLEGAAGLLHTLEVYACVTLGALTASGSVVAWARLDGRLRTVPIRLRRRQTLQGILFAWITLLLVPTMGLPGGIFSLCLAAILSGVLGVSLIGGIGGADMPVVVSLLNAYSGWTAAAAGFMLGNDLLLITGALVGSSGSILAWIMCRAMKRSLVEVLFGGFRGAHTDPTPDTDPVETTDAAALVHPLATARRVVVVPGYGMAASRAHQALAQFVRQLEARDVQVQFALHPIAGRLPGHMNVLLAEAGIPYHQTLGLKAADEAIARADLVLTVGANDIINPTAQDDPHSPLYGMPVLPVWKAPQVIALKRSMAAGYAGVANPLFHRPQVKLLFGDASDVLRALGDALGA